MPQFLLNCQLISVRGDQPPDELTRSILCNTKSTLEQIHQSLFQAMEFFESHAYAFYLKGKPYESIVDEYGSPLEQIPNPAEFFSRYLKITMLKQYSNDEITQEQIIKTVNGLNKQKVKISDLPEIKDASKVTLEALKLEIGQKFFYVFDFGDDWIFQIDVAEYKGKEQATKNHTILLTNLSSNTFPHYRGKIPVEKQTKHKPKTKKQFRRKLEKSIDSELTMERLLSDFSLDEDDSSDRQLFMKEDAEISITNLIKSTKLSDFVPFMLNFHYLLESFDEWSLMQFFQNSNLPAPKKIILASVLLYRTGNFIDNVHGGIFKYFYIQLVTKQYESQEELKDFVLHFFKTLKLCPDDTQLQKLQQALQEIIPLERWDLCSQNLQKTLKTTLSEEQGSKKKNINDQLALTISSEPITIFSKVTAKSFIFLFIECFPQSKEILVTNVHTLITGSYTHVNWGVILLEYLIDQADTITVTPKHLEALEPLIKDTAPEVRQYAYICLWMLTNNLKFLRLGEKDKSKAVQKRFPSILKNPERARNRLLHKIVKNTLEKYEVFNTYSKTSSLTEQSPDAVYIFNVHLLYHTAACTIALLGDQTLDDLHEMIQETFDWDNDHLYSFFMNNRPFNDYETYYSPNDSEEPKASRKKIYTLGLIPGKIFTYVFDFGDDHRFKIETMGVSSQEKTPGPYPKLIKKKGKNPVQYPDEW